jgi:DNA-binding IclR family transcriptional regulator
VGSTAPLYCTGLGKAILAGMAPQEAHRVLLQTDLVPHTPHTITAVGALEAELAEVRRVGYAVDNQEHEIGVQCIAAPITAPITNGHDDGDRKTIAALSVSVPSVRMTDAAFALCRDAVIGGARNLSGSAIATYVNAEEPCAREL